MGILLLTGLAFNRIIPPIPHPNLHIYVDNKNILYYGQKNNSIQDSA